MTSKTVEMELLKATKNTVVYGAHKAGEIITSVYLNKEALPMVPPQKIKIDVHWENAS